MVLPWFEKSMKDAVRPCARHGLPIAAGLFLSASVAHAERPRAPLPKRPLVHAPGPQRILVKFIDPARVRVGLTSESGRDLGALRSLVDTRGLSLVPVFDDPDSIRQLTERARVRSGRAQPDLLGLFELEVGTIDDARALQVLDVVEFVSISEIAPASPVDIAPETPDLTSVQDYLGPAGIDAIGAWEMGYRGASVRLSDIEYAWFLEHEEWNEGTMIPEPGQTPDLAKLVNISDGNHGAAVAGMLIAGDNGYGVTGITPDAVLGVYPQLTIESGPRRPEAILAAAADSVEGDVLLLEIQRTEPTTGRLGPAETEEAVWVATQVATDAGLVVVALAGNGGLDLDSEELQYYMDRGDSGAIIVGAGRRLTRERAGFSSFGERVDVQGWGEEVVTTGYGIFQIYGDDPNQSYTDEFGGTSAASPMVAGVAALVQDAVKSEGGQPLTSQQMRSVLQGTGLPQPGGDTGQIGPLPQAPAAIAAALVPPDDPPTVVIFNPASTQTEDETFTTTIDVAASEGTAYVQLSINGELQASIDDVPPFTFGDVTFPAGTWEVVAVATNVWNVQGTSVPVLLEVGDVAPEGSTGASGSSSSGEEPGSSGSTGDDEGAVTTTGVGTTGELDSSSGGGDDADTNASEGGGCRVGARSSGGGVLAFGLALAGLGGSRRRRWR